MFLVVCCISVKILLCVRVLFHFRLTHRPREHSNVPFSPSPAAPRGPCPIPLDPCSCLESRRSSLYSPLSLWSSAPGSRLSSNSELLKRSNPLSTGSGRHTRSTLSASSLLLSPDSLYVPHLHLVPCCGITRDI